MTPVAMRIAEHVKDSYPLFFEAPKQDGFYRNPWPHDRVPGFLDVLRWKTGRNEQRPRGYRARPLPIAHSGYADFMAERQAATRLFWIGHASFLLQLDGVRIVIDPIFGRAGGFVPRLTSAAIEPAQLTDVAAVLLTHGHHDHFDPTASRQIAEINEGRTLFVVPEGLGHALPAACKRRIELSWWQLVELGPVRAHFVPAQHWHRRGAFDLNRSLWGSYVIEGTHRVYHSGDTGYFGGFRAIAEVFGGIDAACLPLGAYEPRWFMGSQHMSPEQSLAAFADLAASHFVGMHWGTYDLSNEPVEAGPELLAQVAAERSVDARRLHVVLPGGSVMLDGQRGATHARTLHRYQAR
jgi:L-ascorbate metabolism protein UlaG (beta-lactamase superfamily)